MVASGSSSKLAAFEVPTKVNFGKSHPEITKNFLCTYNMPIQFYDLLIEYIIGHQNLGLNLVFLLSSWSLLLFTDYGHPI